MHKITRPNSSVQIAYDDIGEGEPLMFLHGLGAGRAQTTSALKDLPNTRLLAPDMLGHGDSILSDNEAEMSFDAFADDVIAILDHHGLEKVNLGGLSMGSGISINLALRYPERVNKLILLRPSWFCERQPEHLALVAVAGFLTEEYGLEVGEQKLMEHPNYQSLLKENEKVALSINGVFERPQALEAASVLYKMWQDKPFFTIYSLSQIQCDTLILYTSRDELHPVHIAENFAQAIPNSQIAELPARYYDNAGYTEALRKSVTEFLEE